MSNDKNMQTSTHHFARRFALTLLALTISVTTWAQFKGEGDAEHPYLIGSAAEWATFTENINKGVGNKAYYKLTSDIILGSDEKPISTIVGTLDYRFSGNFDGDFHTLYINMERDENYAAPFGIVDGGVISNLKVEGTIVTDHKFAGGIIAYVKNLSNNPTTLTNCISNIHIICDSIVTVDPKKPFDCTHAGLVGQNEKGVLNFENCIFGGWIRDGKEEKTANKCTGFVAWVNDEVNYTNCIMAGVLDVAANTEELKNSMANYHRLSNKARANFNENNYFVTNYTYKGQATQGKQAPSTVQSNTISKIFSDGEKNFFIPAVEINNDVATYYGWRLVENTDYTVEVINEYKTNYEGIYNFAGSYLKDEEPLFALNVETWDATTKTGWYAIASPVAGQRFADVENLTSAVHNIYRYNEKDRKWEEYRNKNNRYSTFEDGRGYLYRTENNGGKIVFKGAPISGNVKLNLSYTTKGDMKAGFNLIGNPYSHNIYKGGAIPNVYMVTGFCILNENGTWTYRSDISAIPVGIAVLVQTTKTNTITIKDIETSPIFKESNDEVWFTVKNDEFSDVAHIEFSDSEGYSKIEHYNEDAPMLYVKNNGIDYASARLTNEKETTLCFESKTMSRYTLSFKANGNFDYLHLIDRMTGENIDMLVDDDYSFISSTADNAERFIVRFSYSDEEAVENTTFAWQNGNDIIVEGEGQLQVFDVTGRMVMNTFVNGSETINLQSQGVYVFRMIGKEVKTQKIVVR